MAAFAGRMAEILWLSVPLTQVRQPAITQARQAGTSIAFAGSKWLGGERRRLMENEGWPIALIGISGLSFEAISS